MRPHHSFQCAPELFRFLFQPPFGELGEGRRIVFSFDKGANDEPGYIPLMSDTTEESLILAPSSTFWMRLSSRARSSIKLRR